jgi:hypothetical protein
MTRKLNDTDRAAVDLMFDRIASTNGGNGGEGYVAVTAAVSEQHLAAVERVLGPLSAMPAPEPSADLAIRTLQRISRATATSIPAIPGTFADPSQPMA